MARDSDCQHHFKFTAEPEARATDAAWEPERPPSRPRWRPAGSHWLLLVPVRTQVEQRPRSRVAAYGPARAETSSYCYGPSGRLAVHPHANRPRGPDRQSAGPGGAFDSRPGPGARVRRCDRRPSPPQVPPRLQPRPARPPRLEDRIACGGGRTDAAARADPCRPIRTRDSEGGLHPPRPGLLGRKSAPRTSGTSVLKRGYGAWCAKVPLRGVFRRLIESQGPS